MKMPERTDAARLLAHKRRVDAQRKAAAIARRDTANLAAMHKVAKAKPA